MRCDAAQAAEQVSTRLFDIDLGMRECLLASSLGSPHHVLAAPLYCNAPLAQTLGIAKSATVADIRRAYRRLVAREHPDKGGDGEKFDVLQRAFRDACKAVQGKRGSDTSGKVIYIYI